MDVRLAFSVLRLWTCVWRFLFCGYGRAFGVFCFAAVDVRLAFSVLRLWKCVWRFLFCGCGCAFGVFCFAAMDVRLAFSAFDGYFTRASP
jgi:hypothetical protein